jgi:UDP-N-acetylmuramoyl-tripeptide--D-alanyl-D-alanine ligase
MRPLPPLSRRRGVQPMDEALWTFAEISAATGAARACEGRASGISIDSRTLQPGDLFVAIRGERTDGHKFVQAAFEQGASAALVESGFHPSSRRPLFYAPDTLKALNALARAARKRSSAAIAAVTGSAGKTGTKEMLRGMLSKSGPTHASEKSYNNLWGVPLSLARMSKNAKFGVFEIGMNHAGEITPLTRLVRPNVAIVTTVAPVHIEFFNSAEEIADAKAEIFDGLEPGGAAILPADNAHFERLAAHACKKGAVVIPFGEAPESEARLLSFEPQSAGSKVTASILGSEAAFTLGAPGKHLALNAIAALAALKLMGANLVAGAEALAQFEAPEGRGRRSRFETPDGAVLIIDETYNANPASMAAALSVLGSIPRADFPRRIAVLGDMLELGRAGPDYHAVLASVVDSSDIDLVFCAGPLMAHLYERLPEEKRGAAANSSQELLPALVDAVRGGDAVTIKGSLGSRMGLLAEALRLNLAARQPEDKKSRDAA